jgi:hypothetical protein
MRFGMRYIVEGVLGGIAGGGLVSIYVPRLDERRELRTYVFKGTMPCGVNSKTYSRPFPTKP